MQVTIDRDAAQASADALQGKLDIVLGRSDLLPEILLEVKGMLAGTSTWDAGVLAAQWSKVLPQNLPTLRTSVELEIQRWVVPLIAVAGELKGVMAATPLTDGEGATPFTTKLAVLLERAETARLGSFRSCLAW